MEKIIGSIILWVFAAPVYLPWLLARFGHYKKWYFSRFVPPFSWRGWIQLWPLSSVFIFYPIIAISPLSDENVMKVWSWIAVFGIMSSIFMVLKTPRWAKPTWQRRLEDRFSHAQISAFIVTWRKLPFSTWCEMIETEDGMFELADYAIENQTTFVDATVRLRGQQLINAEKRGLTKKPAWLSEDELRF